MCGPDKYHAQVHVSCLVFLLNYMVRLYSVVHSYKKEYYTCYIVLYSSAMAPGKMKNVITPHKLPL